jgi:hypothetical protein
MALHSLDVGTLLLKEREVFPHKKYLPQSMFAKHQSTSFIHAKVRSKRSTSRTRAVRRRISASFSSEKDDDSSPLSTLSRRELALIAASTVFSYPDSSIKLAHARNSSLPTVLVIGSTGQTGKLVVSSLSRTNNANVIAGCRSLEKAKKLKLDQKGVELLGGGKFLRVRQKCFEYYVRLVLSTILTN